MADFQRMALKRTELAAELLKIFNRIKIGTIDPEVASRLDRAAAHLNEAEKEIGEITERLQRSMAPPGPGQ